jgi:hypothetical protein
MNQRFAPVKAVSSGIAPRRLPRTVAEADRRQFRPARVHRSELIDIFDQMAAVDAKVHDLNNRANNVGARPRMRTCEMAAHGLDSWDQSKSILEELRLPGFGLGSGTVPLAWPRPAPN